MFNLDLIDKLIAVVAVILGLALFVQSLQSLIKKVFKLKSLQIEQSLAHLFYYVLEKGEATPKFDMIRNMPLLRHVLPRTTHPAERDPQVKVLYDAVADEFRRVGRLTWTGKLMFDSIAKEDLKKFLGKAPAGQMIGKLFPGAADKLAAVQGQVRSLSAALDLLKRDSTSLLKAEELAPIEKLVADVGGVFGGDAFSARTLVSDVVNLQQVDPKEMLQALEEARALIAQALSKAKSDPDATVAVGVLQEAQNGLENMAEAVTAFSGHIASLRGLVSQVENWFDTVMQGFEERYARAMRTTTFILSAFVVVLLNANIINIYRDISTNDARRTLALQSAETYRRAQEARASATPGETPPPAGTAPQATPTPVTPEGLYREGKELIDKNIADFTNLGFNGPAWMKQVPHWLQGTETYKDVKWTDRLWQAGRTIVGWLIMILLLSAGAPFWQDTLESLFGVKNLLRNKSGTPNVAGSSGEGQQKS